MKVLLFGGTFDPPHLGHMDILKNAIQVVHPDCVIVMPSGIPPHKKASATPAHLRLQMCTCFYPLFDNLIVCDKEIKQSGKSYTIHTVQWLKKCWPDADIYLCIGSDMLLTFKEWENYAELLQMTTLVVQSRTDEDVKQVKSFIKELEKEGGKFVLSQADVKQISSTQIRQAYQNGYDATALLPFYTQNIIEQNNLYKMNTSTL